MENIIHIFQYLIDQHNIHITIKDFTKVMFQNMDLEMLKKFNSHSNSYCMYIKNNSFARAHCAEISNIKLYNKLCSAKKQGQPFWGTCYCGVREYVVPITYNHIVLGAILVGQYPCDLERRNGSFERLYRKYSFEPSKLEKLYAENFPDRPLPDDAVLSILHVCATYIASYLSNHFDLNKPKKQNGNQVLLNTIISYIHANLENRIRISDIAEHCHCSESTASHCFQEYMEISIGKYILTRRILKAKKLLIEGERSISYIAEKCGFNSTEYFSYTFKANVGLSPIHYRQQFQTKSNENK